MGKQRKPVSKRKQVVMGLVQFSPVQSLSHDYSTPGFPVHHQLSEFAQTHVHQVGDAIQPSHPL